MRRVAMRGVAGIAAVLCLLAVGAGLAVYLPQAEGLRRKVAEQALTRLWGEPVVVRGRVEMSLWPRPAMTMADVEAQGTEGARAHVGRLVFSLPVYGRLIGGRTPKASQVSITTFFGWPALPVGLAFGMKPSG